MWLKPDLEKINEAEAANYDMKGFPSVGPPRKFEGSFKVLYGSPQRSPGSRSKCERFLEGSFWDSFQVFLSSLKFSSNLLKCPLSVLSGFPPNPLASPANLRIEVAFKSSFQLPLRFPSAPWFPQKYTNSYNNILYII